MATPGADKGFKDTVLSTFYQAYENKGLQAALDGASSFTKGGAPLKVTQEELVIYVAQVFIKNNNMEKLDKFMEAVQENPEVAHLEKKLIAHVRASPLALISGETLDAHATGKMVEQVTSLAKHPNLVQFITPATLKTVMAWLQLKAASAPKYVDRSNYHTRDMPTSEDLENKRALLMWHAMGSKRLLAALTVEDLTGILERKKGSPSTSGLPNIQSIYAKMRSFPKGEEALRAHFPESRSVVSDIAEDMSLLPYIKPARLMEMAPSYHAETFFKLCGQLYGKPKWRSHVDTALAAKNKSEEAHSRYILEAVNDDEVVYFGMEFDRDSIKVYFKDHQDGALKTLQKLRKLSAKVGHDLANKIAEEIAKIAEDETVHPRVKENAQTTLLKFKSRAAEQCFTIKERPAKGRRAPAVTRRAAND